MQVPLQPLPWLSPSPSGWGLRPAFPPGSHRACDGQTRDFPEVPSPDSEETPRNLAALAPHMGEAQTSCNTPGGGGKEQETSGSCSTRGCWDQGDTDVHK